MELRLRHWLIVSLVCASVPLTGQVKGAVEIVLSLHSVPDGLSVFLAQAGKPETLFTQDNLKGPAPLTLRLLPGEYHVGYLLTKVPWASQVGTLDEIQPAGLRLVTLFRDVTVLHYTDKAVPLTGGLREIVQPNRFVLGAAEAEPFIWDRAGDVKAPISDAFNTFFYKIENTTITQVGTVYSIRVDAGQLEHVGIILPERFSRTAEHARELQEYYPSQRRFRLAQPSTEIDALFRSSGIVEHKELLLELLERGGKLIYDGPRPGGSVRVEAGTQVPILGVSQRSAENALSRTSLRDVFTVQDGRVSVRSYASAIVHD